MYKFILLLLTTLIVTTGCGTAPVRFNVQRASAIDIMGHKQIALGTFTGENWGHVKMLMNKVSQNLLETQYFDAVLDRKYMDNIIAEHRLQLSGLVNDTGIVELGNFIGAAALIFGEIDVESYRETLTIQEVVITNRHALEKKDEKGRTLYTNSYTEKIQQTRTGIYNLTITFQMVDVETAQLIASKTMTFSRRPVMRSYKGVPRVIDEENLFLQGVNKISRDFVRQLVPSQVQVRAKFQKDKSLPQAELAIRKMQLGSTDEAITLFNEMTLISGLKQVVEAKTWYNLGLAQGFNQQFDESLKNINKAMNLNPKNKLYDQAIRMIQNEKRQAQKLKDRQ